jgi:trans-AT polyketide synthase/acyltransferase/oxidoreductase domain-containing protein
MSRQMKTYLFPGQGAQKAGMGREFFAEFSDHVSEADGILGYSLAELCGDEARLVQTQFTQPALYVVSCLSYLRESRAGFSGALYAAGHSVGEYAALFAAGCVSFAEGLRLVQKRGECMSQAKGGGMAAVIGKSAEEIERLLLQYGYDSIDIANYNARGQTVISGQAQEIADARPVFEEAGARMYVVLKVSGAFHSRYMQPTADQFRAFLEGFEFAEPRFPVISNVTARPHVRSAIKELLARQIISPVRWLDSITYLKGLGAMEFQEMGGSRVLTNLLRDQ